mgnify:CR=1 FL=1
MITINPQKKPKAILIWLHGLGADENDFVPFVKNLNLHDVELQLGHEPRKLLKKSSNSFFELENVKRSPNKYIW